MNVFITGVSIASTLPLKVFAPQLHISQEFVHLTNRLPVRAEFVPRAPDFPLHDHEFYELCLITQGSVRHLTREGSTWLKRGSIIVVAPGQVHGFSDAKDLALVNVYYLAEWFLANLQALRDIDRLVPLFFQQSLFPHRDLGAIVQFELDLNDLVSCLRDLEDLDRESTSLACQPLFLEAALIKCLVRIARAYGSSHLHIRDDLPAPVLYAQRHLERAMAEGTLPNFKKIACDAGVSYSHFCRLFKSSTGMSAGTYFQRRRIHQSCHRLLTTNSTSTEIAHGLGYADTAHFSRFFKATTGLTPQHYRKKIPRR